LIALDFPLKGSKVDLDASFQWIVSHVILSLKNITKKIHSKLENNGRYCKVKNFQV